MELTVISDDKIGRKGLVAKHSLSILVVRNLESYLFGMGIDPGVLEHNSKELGIGLDTVDYVVVSHEHTPHYGGYRYISAEAPFTDVFIPYGASESLGKLFARNGLKPREVRAWTQLSEGVYLSKPFYGPPYEHFMVFEHGKGLVVLSGCMHPGVTALSSISEFLRKGIYAIVGGFHLANAPSTIVESYTKYLIDVVKPRLVIPLHCSGNEFVNKLRETGLVEVAELSTGDEFRM
ncbi:MAG: MBL fold metallo-hydrolase [Desulfurococcaceae archaeon]